MPVWENPQTHSGPAGENPASARCHRKPNMGAWLFCQILRRHLGQTADMPVTPIRLFLRCQTNPQHGGLPDGVVSIEHHKNIGLSRVRLRLIAFAFSPLSTPFQNAATCSWRFRKSHEQLTRAFRVWVIPVNVDSPYFGGSKGVNLLCQPDGGLLSWQFTQCPRSRATTPQPL